MAVDDADEQTVAAIVNRSGRQSRRAASQGKRYVLESSDGEDNDAAEKLDQKEEACGDEAKSEGGKRMSKLRKRIRDDNSDESDFNTQIKENNFQMSEADVSVDEDNFAEEYVYERRLQVAKEYLAATESPEDRWRAAPLRCLQEFSSLDLSACEITSDNLPILLECMPQLTSLDLRKSPEVQEELD